MADEALEGGETLEGLTPAQMRDLKQMANKRVGDLMKTRAADIASGDDNNTPAYSSLRASTRSKVRLPRPVSASLVRV